MLWFHITFHADYKTIGLKEISQIAKAADKLAVKSATESLLRGAMDSMVHMNDNKKT